MEKIEQQTKCKPDECPCIKIQCEHHGNCYSCVKAHRDKNSIVYCLRDIVNKRLLTINN